MITARNSGLTALSDFINVETVPQSRNHHEDAMKTKLLSFYIPFVLLIAIAVKPARAAQAPLKSRGFTNLADLAQLPIPFQSTGVLTKRSFINASPEIVENVLRGIVDSLAFIAQPENKPAVLKSLVKGLRLPNVEQAVEGYDSLPMLYDRRIYPRVDGVRNVIRLLGVTNEKNPSPES
jgi:hypothetical protein